jgi:hypothetical protein
LQLRVAVNSFEQNPMADLISSRVNCLKLPSTSGQTDPT